MMGGIIKGVAAGLTLAERKLAQLQEVERRRRWARRALKIENLWDIASGSHFRYRDQLWPWAILVILLVFRQLAAWSASPAAVFLLSLLGAGAVAFYLRSKLDRRTEWLQAAACLGGAVLGLTLVAHFGTGYRLLNIACALGWATASTQWWLHHEVRWFGRSSNSTFVKRWDERVRDKKGPMSGAQLTGPVVIESQKSVTDSYVVQLVPGEQHLGLVWQNMPKISSALQTPMEDLVMERHPDHPKDPTILRLNHVVKSPIDKTVYFDEPRYEEGRILLGPYADGIGEAYFRLYTENSMWGGFLLGGIGSGKSRLTEIIAVTVRSLRDVAPTVVWYMDGQEGASSPMLFKHADWAVGTSGALKMLGALERIGAFRNRQNRARGEHGFTPTVDRPGILVVADELHALVVLNPTLFAKIAREFRKLGIAILGADQDSNLTVFGNLDVLRASMLAGNGIAMRVNSRIAGNLIPGLNMDPFDLPILPGYGVLVAPPGSDARTAGFRGRYAPDEKDAEKEAARGKTLPVPTIEEWFERYEPLELDKGAARAAGKDYLDRREIAERERGELLDFLNTADAEEIEHPLEALAELVATGDVEADPETKKTLLAARQVEIDKATTCADAILSLPWDQFPEQTPLQMIDGLKLAGYNANPSTLTKALQRLRDAGDLIQDEPRKPYRRARPIDS